MSHIAEIYPSRMSVDASNLTVILCSTEPTPSKFTQLIPYALLKVNRYTIIEKQIQTIYNVYPQCEIIVIAGYHAPKVYNKLKTKNVRVVYNPNFDITNSLNDFGLGLYSNLNAHVIYIDGNTLFSSEAISGITDKRRSTALIGDFLSESHVGVTLNNSTQVAFFADTLAPHWGNIVYLTGNELNSVERYALNPKHYNYYLYEGLNKAIDAGGKLHTYTPSECDILRVLQPSDIIKAEHIFR